MTARQPQCGRLPCLRESESPFGNSSVASHSGLASSMPRSRTAVRRASSPTTRSVTQKRPLILRSAGSGPCTRDHALPRGPNRRRERQSEAMRAMVPALLGALMLFAAGSCTESGPGTGAQSVLRLGGPRRDCCGGRWRRARHPSLATLIQPRAPQHPVLVPHHELDRMGRRINDQRGMIAA